MIKTSAARTPGSPRTNIPLPPYTFSRYFAPACTAIRPATSLIGVSKGRSPEGSCTVSYAIATIPDLITARVSASDAAKWKRSEEHTSELQSQSNLVCRLLLEKKKNQPIRDRPPRPAADPHQPH